ncbi:Uu.00g041040.m01.CDS01 [Anthostomella pinea]|uniref:Large ribosomal subunit protein P1 n=1 Tax=Anthostomella pinea TaxID=933095 RepID=A0AAI8VBC3_9PEZI|nr:Uu.00g041040.m01.CDS01 [Anthostomella pinea]
MPTDPQLAISYAALVLADEGVPLTPDKLQTLLKAAGVDDVEAIWSTIFTKALKDKDMTGLLTTVQASQTAPTGPAVGGEVKGGGPEEDGSQSGDGGHSDGDDSGSEMGMGLFDD